MTCGGLPGDAPRVPPAAQRQPGTQLFSRTSLLSRRLLSRRPRMSRCRLVSGGRLAAVRLVHSRSSSDSSSLAAPRQLPAWVTSTRTMPPPTVTATVTVSPGSPDLLCRTLLPRIAHQKDGDIPARVPRAEHRAHERAGHPCPLRPPGKRHALPNRQPSHQRTRPAARPGKTTGLPGGHMGDARSTRRRTSSRNMPAARPVRGRPWNPTVHRSFSPPGRRPLYVRGRRNTAAHSATR